MNQIELAWAAGLFDGEGYVGAKAAGQWLQLKLSLGQTDRQVLDRFQRAVGAGKVRGPYETVRGKSKGHKPAWEYTVQAQAEAQQVIELLLPYLSPVKKAQCLEALEKFRNYSSSLKRKTWKRLG